MAFSSALTLTDLNDFISPSQACIKPVEQSNKPSERNPDSAATEIRIDASGSYYEVSTSSGQPTRRLETAQISLNDCLACSGCITSAESILITMQSHEEVSNVLAANPPAGSCHHKTPILSVSPQSLASLAASISSTSRSPITLAEVLHRVRAFAKSIGFERTYDTTFARHIALLESAREFRERREHGAAGSAAPGSATEFQGTREAGYLPMLASACPGWVCYAEKTKHDMLPHISRTKSPQQMMGTLVKGWFAKKWGKRPDEIYHVTVMPCYDKKLEASREDFFDADIGARDVDCVLTTGELDRMMRERGWAIDQPLIGELSKLTSAEELEDALPELLEHPGSSAGGYLHALIIDAANAIPVKEGVNVELTLETRQVRGADFEEVRLVKRGPEDHEETILRAARCYGFRNLQNLVRRVARDSGIISQAGSGPKRRGAAAKLAERREAKRREREREGGVVAPGGKSATTSDWTDGAYDYVEVMACPGGCVNGGGQLRPISTVDNTVAAENNTDTARWGNRAWTARVERAYWHGLPTPPPSPPSNIISLPSSDELPGKSSMNLIPSQVSDSRLAGATVLALRVLRELCLPDTLDDKQKIPVSWNETLSEAAEVRRRSLFRTTYRAVQADVPGIAVQW